MGKLQLNGNSDSSCGGAAVKKKISDDKCSKDGNVLPQVPSPRPCSSENPCIMETRVYSGKKIKLRDENCWIDQISRLPDELLVNILSCLSFKEAAASSILSRRWRYLWTLVSKLDFEGLGCTTSNPDYDIPGFPLSSEGKGSIHECWEYVRWVEDVLRLRDKSAAMEELRISFSLNSNHQSYIDSWIGFAIAKKVVRLDINLVQTRFAQFSIQQYTFPYKLLRDNESHSCGFKDLRLIRMVSVIMSDGALEIFLRSCPLLEEIFFARCRGLSAVKIVNPFPALKRLSLLCCSDLDSVEVRDSNLVYFMYRRLHWNVKHFLLKNNPLLVEMNVGGNVTGNVEEFLKMFSSCLPQLEKLTIEKKWCLSIMEADMICSSVKMSNLKQLMWKFVSYPGSCDLEAVTILVGALPLLQRLVVMSYGDEIKGHVDHFHNFTRNYKRTYTYSDLKQLEFVGYHGNLGELNFVVHKLKNAAALEEVIIHPAKETRISGRLGEYTKQETDAFRSFAHSQLTPRMPSTVTLKIH